MFIADTTPTSLHAHSTNLTSLQIPHPKYWMTEAILKILNDPHLQDLDSIIEIRKNDEGYLLITKTGEVQVDVKYLPRSPIGAKPDIQIEFHDPVTAQNSGEEIDISELKRILQDDTLFEKLGGEFILKISKENGRYVISARSFEILVDINPETLEIYFSEPIPTVG